MLNHACDSDHVTFLIEIKQVKLRRPPSKELPVNPLFRLF